jgi:hypothetical protein
MRGVRLRGVRSGWVPEYPSNGIVLEPGHLASLTDDKPVTNVPLLGGATPTYHVTESGSTVPGTLSWPDRKPTARARR